MAPQNQSTLVPVSEWSQTNFLMEKALGVVAEAEAAAPIIL